MKYLFLNSFSFEKPKNRLLESDILNVLQNLGILLKNIQKFNSELIFHDALSVFTYNGLNIRYYLQKLDRDLMILLLSKIQKQTPFCSNIYDEYQNEEDIVMGNCKVKNTQIDVLENFLSCAIYLNAPIITSRILCDNKELSNKEIEIQCDNETYLLNNYFLEDADVIINNIEENIKLTSTNWEEWRKESLPFNIQEHYYIRSETSLGRGSDNDIVINDKYVSYNHLRIIEEDGIYYIEDLNSANGTLLNGEYISDAIELKDKDLIDVGRIQFLFVDEEVYDD